MVARRRRRPGARVVAGGAVETEPVRVTATLPWFEWLRSLSMAPRFAAAAALPLAAFALASFLAGGLSVTHLHLLLFATVLLGALLFGLAAGLVGATLGFALLLWRGVGPAADGGWSLDWRAVVDSFLWFAVAKLAAALIAAPRAGNRTLAAAKHRAEEEARRSGLLLEEWSHRVSNDLYLQVSMLRAQAGAEPEAAPALRAAAGRVQVLGRVHGRLSRGAAAGAVVDSRDFLEGLMADLRTSAGGARPVALAVAAEAHVLPLTAAGDVGLVLNELVTNALKHAFPGNRAGVVRATFRRDGDLLELAVADNGVGMAAGPLGRTGDGVGGQLLRGLATQLGGRLETAAGEVGGTVRTLRFPVSAPDRGGAPGMDAAGEGFVASAASVPAARLRGRPEAGSQG